MKLTYRYDQIAELFGQEAVSDQPIYSVAYDTRRIFDGTHQLFFALSGDTRNGHDYLHDAYKKGVRHFVVSNPETLTNYNDVHVAVVPNTLDALMQFAHWHRSKFSIPVIAITGSYGKTTCKEWLSELLEGEKHVTRSPKSFNSRLGVALSLLEITDQTEIAVIEAGITHPGDMKILKDMILPTHGVFTGLGMAHRSHFTDEQEHLDEKLLLFADCKLFVYPSSVSLKVPNGKKISTEFEPDKEPVQHDRLLKRNEVLAASMAREFIGEETIQLRLPWLENPSMRLEVIDGVSGNVIINDGYQLDAESLQYALQFQLAKSEGRSRVVVLNAQPSEEIDSVLKEFSPDHVHYFGGEQPSIPNYENTCILVKGKRSSELGNWISQLKQHPHQTFVQIDLTAIRDNIQSYRSRVPESVRILSMVKAYSYGSDATKIGRFLADLGIDYLGVAYTNEGIELRNAAISSPVLVMNADSHTFRNCILHQLEPAVYALNQLEEFIRECILLGVSDYPIHIKLETGMHRLGFEEKDIPELISKLNAQPEVRVQSVYSHLAESDVPNSSYTDQQIEQFDRLSSLILDGLPYSVMRHLLNSEGVVNYAYAYYDMIRLGIGMYGISSQYSWKEQLKPSISWHSEVSQVKVLQKGDTVGYNCAFVAEKETTIAVIPVGYADGFRRALGNGRGGVYIKNSFCKTLGNVCMDMIMVDVSGIDAQPGDFVEIVGHQQSLETIASLCDTIPYEMLTGLSSRMQRIYLEG